MAFIKKIISVFILLSCINFLKTNAQDYGLSHIKPKKVSRWSVGVLFSPDWEGRFFKGKKNDDIAFADSTRAITYTEINNETARSVRSTEHAGFSTTFGVHAIYDLSRRWFVRGGIYYSNKKIRSDGFVTGIDSVIFFAEVSSSKVKQSFPFLEIPITFHYLLTKPFDKNKTGTCYTTYAQYNRKKPLFYIFLGPAITTNLNRHEYFSRRWSIDSASVFTSSRSAYVNTFSLWHFGFYVGVGMMKYFNDHLFLTLEPTFRFFPVRWYTKRYLHHHEYDGNVEVPKVSWYGIKDKPWSAGFQVALNYHF